MNADSPNPNPHDPRLDDHDPVWRLLAQAPPPEPDAWFTARTMARCRHEGVDATGMISLAGMWRWALGGGLGICVATILFVTHIHSSSQNHSSSLAPNKQQNVQEAFEIMASLDSDSSSPSWQDSSL